MKRLLLKLFCIELYIILIEVHMNDSHIARSYITNHGDVNVVVKLKEDVEKYMGFTNSHILTNFLLLPLIAVLLATEYIETKIVLRLCSIQ